MVDGEGYAQRGTPAESLPPDAISNSVDIPSGGSYTEKTLGLFLFHLAKEDPDGSR